jgi:hypothetical protein
MSIEKRSAEEDTHTHTFVPKPLLSFLVLCLFRVNFYHTIDVSSIQVHVQFYRVDTMCVICSCVRLQNVLSLCTLMQDTYICISSKNRFRPAAPQPSQNRSFLLFSHFRLRVNCYPTNDAHSVPFNQSLSCPIQCITRSCLAFYCLMYFSLAR